MSTLKIVMGKSLAGKTYYVDHEKRHKLITCTTRPKRPYEHNNQDYYFRSTAQYAEDALKNNALAIRSYKVANGQTWYYYISKEKLLDQLKKYNELYSILDLKGYLELRRQLEDESINVEGIYLDTPLRIRLERYLNTERKQDDKKEFVRRLYDDEFNAFNQIDNPEFCKENEIKIINE